MLRLVVTPGEPAGIGPELVVRYAQQPLDVELVAVCSSEILLQAASQLGIPCTLNTYSPELSQQSGLGRLSVLHTPLRRPNNPGQLEPENAEYVLDTLRQAVELCQQGQAQALVTGPVHKGVINQAGIPFTGHTEFLAQLGGVNQVVMMLACEGLRVALATTHLPLRDVADAIKPDTLETTIKILHHDLVTQFGIADPNILVCGLNPHAGENGHMGSEEIEVISPVIEKLRSAHHWRLSDPLPADTLFTPHHLEGADAVLAMYHDQGLPVLKHKGFGAAVNITLGLPFTRTSVDHGTAIDLVGKGIANLGSLGTAIDYAKAMAAQRA